jgi:hypothetical protein
MTTHCSLLCSNMGQWKLCIACQKSVTGLREGWGTAQQINLKHAITDSLLEREKLSKQDASIANDLAEKNWRPAGQDVSETKH